MYDYLASFVEGDFQLNSRITKIERWSYQEIKKLDDTFNSFDITRKCDRLGSWADRQTERPHTALASHKYYYGDTLS